MGSLDETSRTNLIHRTVIDTVSFRHHISIGNKRRLHLLVTVLSKLLLEGAERIVLRVHGSADLQLIVDEQVHILKNIFLVDDTLRVVLIIAVLKLRAQHRLTVDGHNHGIIGLCHHR